MNLDKVIKYVISIGILLLLGISIFSISDQFNNTVNDSKFYYTSYVSLGLLLFISGIYKNIDTSYILNKKTLFYINFICFIEACFGIGQYFKWFNSYNNSFAVTGHFENPAGIATVLSLGFGIGCFAALRAKKVTRLLLFIFNSIILSAIILSESRSGIITAVITILTYLIYFVKSKNVWVKLPFKKGLLALLILLFIGIGVILFKQKQDSAHGRILIWTICTEMIQEKPLLGHGTHYFEAEYMNHQAKYFEQNKESKFTQLADNVKNPFNLFLKITIAYGLVGLLLFLSVLVAIYFRIRQLETNYKLLTLNGIISIVILSSVTYPFYYSVSYVFLFVILLPLLPNKKIVFNNTLVTLVLRVFIVGSCLVMVYNLNTQMGLNKQWTRIAQQSLKENNSSVLSEYQKLYDTALRKNAYFLYNYGAELNVYKNYTESIKILHECQKEFNDYDVQMLLADNYYKSNQKEKSIACYQMASQMIPCRFLPLYFLYKTNNEMDNDYLAKQYAFEIQSKQVKIESPTIKAIQLEINTFLKENSK